MIILAIKYFLFSEINSYSLERKSHTSHFIYLFYKKIIRGIYTIFVITIKDLEICLGNFNLALTTRPRYYWVRFYAHCNLFGIWKFVYIINDHRSMNKHLLVPDSIYKTISTYKSYHFLLWFPYVLLSITINLLYITLILYLNFKSLCFIRL